MKIQKIFSVIFCLLAVSCFSRLSDFSQARWKLHKGQCAESFRHFSYLKNLTRKQKSFALKAGQFCEKREPQIAVLFYEIWLKESGVASGDLQAVEKKLAEVSFYKTGNYEKAVFYYDRLLRKGSSPENMFENQYGLAESFFKLKKYSQSLLEVEKILKQPALSLNNRQEALQLKGSLLMALEDYERAIPFFKKQVERFPEKAGVFRKYLAIIFETQGRYSLAIEELRQIPGPASEEKIQDMNRLLARQPKGFNKDALVDKTAE